MVLPLKPTHRIVHASNYVVDIFISDEDIHNLTVRDRTLVDKARKTICDAFDEACTAKYGEQWKNHNSFVTWNQLIHRALVAA